MTDPRGRQAGFGRALLKAMLALPQIVPRAPIRPLEWVTAPAERESVVFAAEDALGGCGDLYRPRPLRRRPGIVMALGANDLGSRDPRAVTLADALARSGFTVLVVAGARPQVAPDAADPTDLARAPARAAAAFNYLAQRADVDATQLGFVGVCLGGGACLLAASQVHLAAQVAFVFLIGPYFSLRSLLRAGVTRTSVAEDGRPRPWPVRPYALERMRAWLLGALEADERAQVLRLLRERATAADDLSPAACATLRLLCGAAPEDADGLIDALHAPFLRVLEVASPMGQLAALRAPTFIMHGVSDGLVPVEESRRLARALRGQVPLRYAEFELFEHVDASRPLAAAVFAREVWRLVGHVEPLMRYAV